MRYIDLSQLVHKVPPPWKEKATAALAEVRASSTVDDRRRALDKHSGLWGEADVKKLLASASHGKCWYCESREVRSDAPVDHFRPKSRVDGCPEHEGYWWLAFDFRNYRYCCTYCNSTRVDHSNGSRGGKQTHFPLLNPEERVFDEGSVDRERPTLLDPTRAVDTLLLYFREDGVPEPRYPDEKGVRAQRSIEIYHLNHTGLVEARLEALNRARVLIRLGQEYYDSWLRDGSDELAFETVVSSLKKLCAEDAEYSAAVIDLIKGFRDDKHEWIDRVS